MIVDVISQIAEAKAQRDLGPLVLKETEHLAGKYELALAEMREGQEASYDAKLLALGNKLRQEVVSVFFTGWCMFCTKS